MRRRSARTSWSSADRNPWPRLSCRPGPGSGLSSGRTSSWRGLDQRLAGLRDEGAVLAAVLGDHHGEAHHAALFARLLVPVDDLLADPEGLAGPGRRAVEGELLLAMKQPPAVETVVNGRAFRRPQRAADQEGGRGDRARPGLGRVLRLHGRRELGDLAALHDHLVVGAAGPYRAAHGISSS